jgi:hypothetical protein
MKKALIVVAAITAISGCAAKKPQLTSLELQSIQSREYSAEKKIVFQSTLSVFQDLGYVVQQADLETGFITAKSPTKNDMVPFVGMSMTDTKATAFVEQVGAKSKVRLNFVASNETSNAYGMKSSQDTPVEEPSVYQNALTKIQEAVFIRSANTQALVPAK